jgi:hypothetical protein
MFTETAVTRYKIKITGVKLHPPKLTLLLPERRNRVEGEEFYLLGYNELQSLKSELTFRRDLSPPYSGSKNKPIKKPL